MGGTKIMKAFALRNTLRVLYYLCYVIEIALSHPPLLKED